MTQPHCDLQHFGHMQTQGLKHSETVSSSCPSLLFLSHRDVLPTLPPI